MHNEKMKILEMIQDGKIAATEGYELLKAIDETDGSPAASINQARRFLRIRVTTGQHNKVNVNIPLALLKVATKFAGIGMKFIPEEARLEMQKKGVDLENIDFDELIQLIDQGLVDGKLVDVDTDDSIDGHTKVEIYVE